MEDKPLEIELVSSSTVCAGMTAAFLCRSVANRAGAYAPGIHERVFSSLREPRFGGDLDRVAAWFRVSSDELFALGYRLRARRVAFRTPSIATWVAGGDGFRAAILTTDGQRFHNGKVADDAAHAVGLLAKPGKSRATVGLVDAWPGVEAHRAPDAKLEPAHRDRKYATLLVFWTGHS